ncbi:Tripeptidyl-peptidase sed3 [Mycena sanguinolenta]|uniref:tripeptidyl-peptidase II n=1 Tax=Mycena sanguinolenta TaxID=230812 RepID=A0A8H7DCG1_9AGAR|nr:Tripeptidyl-peptidase sed3 [Mycena sanguinolenta]
MQQPHSNKPDVSPFNGWVLSSRGHSYFTYSQQLLPFVSDESPFYRHRTPPVSASAWLAATETVQFSKVMVYTIFFLNSLITLATASPVPRVLHSSRSSAPLGFASLGPAPPDQSLKLRFGLASNNAPGLEAALLDVSTPSSANYGKHLTKDEVNAYLAPSNETLVAVQNWLSSNNVTAVSSSGAGDWLTATIPVSKANALLGANYETFVHVNSNTSFARTLKVSLPPEVAGHIDEVHPTTAFSKPLTAGPVVSIPARANSNDTQFVTPATLQALYGIPATPANQSSNGIAASWGQFAQIADVKSFLGQFRTDLSSSTTFFLQILDDGHNIQSVDQAGLEAVGTLSPISFDYLAHFHQNLDTQYTIGMASNVTVTFVSVGPDNQDGAFGFLDIVNFLSGEDNIPPVFTTSYGFNEIDGSKGLSTKLCNAYMGLGARGTSVLFSSGDGGVAGNAGNGEQCDTFQPTFPSSCPYVTSVGSTHGSGPEVASDFSSGGFSNIFPIPSYQADAVAGYLKALGSTNQGLFNTSGRGFPDIAAQGENVQIITGGAQVPVQGTSCSSPIFASVIALINDELIANGKPTLGFLNPFLYSNAAALNDVTSGSNPGCGTNGFPAKKGWDPVTGLGTPNFAALRKAARL